MSEQKPVAKPKIYQKPSNRFVVTNPVPANSEVDTGPINWSDDDTSDEEEAPVAPSPTVKSRPASKKRPTRTQSESAEVDRIMAENGLVQEPVIEKFVTN